MHWFLLMGICISQVLSHTSRGFSRAEMKKMAIALENPLEHQKNLQSARQTLTQQIQAEKLDPKEQYGLIQLSVYLPLDEHDAQSDKSLRSKMLSFAQKLQRAMTSLHEMQQKIVKHEHIDRASLKKEEKILKKQLAQIASECKKAHSAQNKQRFLSLLTFFQGRERLLQDKIKKINKKPNKVRSVFYASALNAPRTVAAH